MNEVKNFLRVRPIECVEDVRKYYGDRAEIVNGKLQVTQVGKLSGFKDGEGVTFYLPGHWTLEDSTKRPCDMTYGFPLPSLAKICFDGCDGEAKVLMGRSYALSCSIENPKEIDFYPHITDAFPIIGEKIIDPNCVMIMQPSQSERGVRIPRRYRKYVWSAVRSDNYGGMHSITYIVMKVGDIGAANMKHLSSRDSLLPDHAVWMYDQYIQNTFGITKEEYDQRLASRADEGDQEKPEESGPMSFTYEFYEDDMSFKAAYVIRPDGRLVEPDITVAKGSRETNFVGAKVCVEKGWEKIPKDCFVLTTERYGFADKVINQIIQNVDDPTKAQMDRITVLIKALEMKREEQIDNCHMDTEKFLRRYEPSPNWLDLLHEMQAQQREQKATEELAAELAGDPCTS